MIINRILTSLKNSSKIAVLPHIMADGDALGSCLALALALKKLDKNVKVFTEEEVPDIYQFLPGIELLQVYSGAWEVFDTVITLDTGDMDRLGKRADIFNNASVTINVDHHSTNSEFAFYNYVDTGSSAVGEIVYQMIKLLGLDLDRDMSVCLYTAITTDTGGFRYSNTTAITHQIAGDLINNGVNVAEVSQQVFETTSMEKVKLTGAAIQNLELLENGKVAFITLTDAVIKETGGKEADCDGIVNIARNIKGVEVAVMLRQRDNGEIKVNLRSKTYVDVAAIASMFGGGGHKRAAGCTLKGDLKEARKKLLQDIGEVL